MPPSSASIEPLPSVTSTPPLSTNFWISRESFPADAAGDVVGRRGRAVTRRLLRLLERHRAPRLRNALDLLGQLEIDVAVEQHVVLCAQVAGANVFVAHVRIRNVALIECVAQPADGVRVRPRHPHAEPRRLGGVTCDIGQPSQPNRSRVRHAWSRSLQRAAEPGLRRQNPRARGIVRVADLERALRDFDLELRQPIARFEQAFLPGVLHHVRRSAAGDLAARLRRFGQRHRRRRL